MDTTWFGLVLKNRRARLLTATHKDVLWALRSFRGHGGIFPSHEALAQRAGCSVSTVQRALERARELGLVRWAERRIRSGWRWFRTSNVYELIVPENPAKPTTGQNPRGALSGQTPRGKTRQELLGRGHAEELRVLLEAAHGLPDLLAARRAVFQRQ